MVYHKLWVDYSAANTVIGAKLTLDLGNGSLLLASLTTLVLLAGGAVWKIVAYVVFRLAVREYKTDALGASLRFIIANAGSPLGDAWMLFRLGLRWRVHTKWAFWRCFRMLLLPVTIWVAFTGSSLLVSKLTAPGYLDDLAPQDSTFCGLRYFGALSPNDTDMTVAWSHDRQQDTRAAQAWVQQCYGTGLDNDVSCASLPMNSWSYVASDVPCPWEGNRCILGDAWQMDTGWLDSLTHLGIDAPKSDRFGFRVVNTCSVIDATDLAWEIPDNTTTDGWLIKYSFGNTTIEPFNVTYSYSTHTALDNVGFSLTPYPGVGIDLISSMNRTDGNLTLAFFAANSVVYRDPNNDPLYSASGKYNFTNQLGQLWISPDHWVRVMACFEQYQWLNPTNGKTTSLNSINHNEYDSLDLNIQQQATLVRIYSALLYSNTYYTLSLGAGSLLANFLVWSNEVETLPDNQWQKEVQYWFETSLANLATNIIDFPTNTHSHNDNYSTVIDISNNTALAYQCNTQLVRTTGSHQTFSVAGIAIVLFFSITFIITSLTLGCCVRRRGGRGKHAEIGYRSLVMQRWALEGRGYKDWLPSKGGIPVRPGAEVDIPNPCLVGGTIRFPRKVVPVVVDLGEGDEEEGVVRENVGFIRKGYT